MSAASSSQFLSGFATGARIKASTLVSLLAHAVILLGVGFTLKLPEFETPGESIMEVILVEAQSPNAPEDKNAQLAQANLDTGGTEDDQSSNAPAPPPQPAQALGEAGFSSIADTAVTRKAIAALAAMTDDEGFTIDHESTENVNIVDQQLRAEEQIEIPFSQISGDETYKRRGEREIYISGRTREYRFASYMEDWRKTVEQIGNEHYPKSARSKNINGSLVLNVAILPDGSLREVKLLRSSGKKILDNAALRIVRLAAPFPPFPASFGDEIEVLNIARTWEFSRGDTLISPN